MNGLVWSGVLLAMLGGTLMGSFTGPMKFTRNWAWENTWLVYSIVGLLCIPVTIAWLSVPDLLAVYRGADAHAVELVLFFGFGWGVGSILFGIGIHILGMGLGFAIILGLTAALGSLIPLVVLSPQALHTTRGATVLIGLMVVVLGIILCAKAGSVKNASAGVSLPRVRFRLGLMVCVGSGAFNAMLNLALAFGAPVAQEATGMGATSTGAQNSIWALAVCAGALANVGYSLFLLLRNRSWDRFAATNSGKNFVLAGTMGVLWMAGISIYGSGASALGDLGAAIGWPLFMSMVIITGNVWGFMTGEWTGAPRTALRLNLLGVAVLIAAVAVISRGAL